MVLIEIFIDGAEYATRSPPTLFPSVNKTFNKQEIELLIIVAWREFAISQRMIQTVRIQTLYIDFTFNY